MVVGMMSLTTMTTGTMPIVGGKQHPNWTRMRMVSMGLMMDE